MRPSKSRHMPSAILSVKTPRPNATAVSRSPSPSYDLTLKSSPSTTSSIQPATPKMASTQHVAQSPCGVRTDVHDLPLIGCCCGRLDCEILKNNCAILTHVEDDMRAAAQLGQALLHRHETYMADAERDRLALVARIEQLLNDKEELEASNERTQKENQHLMNRIDSLNYSVQDADTRIQQLEASLLSSEQTVRRLESASARAADMERQIAVLEYEQDTLRNTVNKTESENRDTMQRWRRAERSIVQLQEQIDRMEQEAKEERERHVEILGRMERQREVERELNTAAGRLKGAAAAKTLSSAKGLAVDTTGSNVVSHFVRDLLSDNANLQLGMIELRELLMNSHDEIQALREQLMSHQPLPMIGQVAPASSTVSESIDSMPPSPSLQGHPQGGGGPPTKEVHVHHHYHVAPTKRTGLKSKKKRNSLIPGLFNPPVSTGAPAVMSRSSVSLRLHSPHPSIAYSDMTGSDNGLMSPTLDIGTRGHCSRDSIASSVWASSKRDSINTAVSSNRRDSIFSERLSEYAASSVASSPVSTSRMSLLNNDVDMTPCPSQRKYKKRVSDISVHVAAPGPQTGIHIHAIAEEEDGRSPPGGIQRREICLSIAEELAGLEDAEDFEFGEDADESCADDESMDEEFGSQDEVGPLRSLRKHVSHESIMSLPGGLDIYTLKSRPSQLTLRPLGMASAVVTDVVAQSTMSYKPSSDIRSSLAGLASRHGPGSDAASIYSSSPSNNGDVPAKGRSGGWSKWVPWGGYTSTAFASTAVSTVSTSASSAASSVGSDNGATPTQSPIKAKDATTTPAVIVTQPLSFFRNVGVNQPGEIPGYWTSVKSRGLASRALADNLSGAQ